MVIHSVSTRDQTMFLSVLEDLDGRHEHMRLDLRLTSERGRMSPGDLDELCPDWREREAFCSGPGELLDALKDVHAGGSPMSSQIARKVVQSFRRNETENNGETVELSPREREVLELLARGYLYKEIAEMLKISVQTVNTYIRRIYEKLHVRSRAQAVAKYANLPMGATH